MNRHSVYPVFLSISNKPCCIIGGGSVALRKARELIDAGADVTIVAESPSRGIEQLSKDRNILLKTKRFEAKDIEGAFLVFAATDDETVNSEVARAANRHKILINVVDAPEFCDFYSGAVVKRGPLRIAISTNGRSPGIAGKIRKELEEKYPESFGDYIELAGKIRQYLLTEPDCDTDLKNTALSWLTREETRALYEEFGEERVWEQLKILISS